MENRIIHIVAFNVPYPPNYGGVIDVFYKIKALHDLGIKINLHCFDYGRGQQQELNSLCHKVFYYKRQTGVATALSKVPYIVLSRSNKELLNNLNTDSYPILFEGLHCTFFLNSPLLKDRIKIVRTHNIEHNYYKQLAKKERNVFIKQYFITAARKLKNFEAILANASQIAAISETDHQYFESNYGNTFWLPPFHANIVTNIKFGTGNYALYHGNLSVAENISAALFLINAFKKHDSVYLIIAGKNPDKKIINKANNAPNITIIGNPSQKEMKQLINEAQVHLLPTFQATGIKLKLIDSLYNGRHCIVNDEMVVGTGLSVLCHHANSSTEFVSKTQQLMHIPFEDKDLLFRKEILSKRFDNQRNAELLLAKIIDINPGSI